MPYKVHRNNDPRVCGAVTAVQNQSHVKVNNELWAVLGSFNNHGHGGLINSTGSKIMVENKYIIVHGPDHAVPDDYVIGLHEDPKTDGGSGDVFAY